MHKRLLPMLAMLCLISLVVVAPAHAVYLDSSWYAQLTNVSVAVGSYPLPWSPFSNSSTHLNVVGSGSGPWAARFSVPVSGTAPTGERAWWGNEFLEWDHTFGRINFDYTTYWSQPNLVLELWTDYMPGGGNQDDGSMVWSSALTGLRSGHATVNLNPNGYFFELVAVPEPGSIFSLGSLCAAGLFGGVSRKAYANTGTLRDKFLTPALLSRFVRYQRRKGKCISVCFQRWQCCV